MPELPEVQTIVNDLNKILLNKKIIQVEVLDSRLAFLKKSPALLGQTIVSITRRAKHLVFLLANNNYLVIHLKMTGQLIWLDNSTWLAGGHPTKDLSQKNNHWPNKSTRVIFNFSDSSQLFFNDTRRFGWIKLMSPLEWQNYQERLGIEPLDGQLTVDFLQKLIHKHPRSKIKTLLLNQQYLVGLGNIYVDESLFAARIKPDRLALSLDKNELKLLQKNIITILKSAIARRGTSFSDYRDSRGQKGNFSEKLQVYGRNGQACYQCGQSLQKIKLNGRGTHFCPICQK
ncbi:MAG TPA: DNA-formamidopyrimidine glycosylase [bacterium]|nr:DNA-formamidopyrimidine glycosylase [bacterium]